MKHRKLTSLLAAALLAFPAAVFPPAPLKPPAITAQAATEYTSEDGRFKYTRNTSQAVNITKYLGTETNVTIPSYLDGYSNQKVVAIGKSAFKNNKTVKTVTIPAEVQYILEHAFDNCKKMTKVTIKGRCRLDDYAFYNCTALKNLVMNNPDCTTYSYTRGLNIFTNCKSLKQINGKDVIYYTSVSGYQKPRMRKEQQYNDPTHKIIKTFFTRSEHVGFVDQYCTELCCWIRDTQTRDWMSEAIKARQYHDWLIDHCYYEDCNCYPNQTKITESLTDPENMLYSAVFLSYGLGIRGSEIGEATCLGIAKAYTMLLRTSGIDSVVVGAGGTKPEDGPPGHAWNLVKFDGKYYHSDVCTDEMKTHYELHPINGDAIPYPLFHDHYYCNFMFATSENNYEPWMHVQNPQANCIVIGSEDPGYVHPLASYEYKATENGAKQDALFAKCVTRSSVIDPNHDGILNGDWNFDGEANRRDSGYYIAACEKMNCSSIPQNKMWKYLYKLIKIWEMSPQDVYDELYS